MNYFGMIFSFMIPGVLLGLVAAAGIREASVRRRKRACAIRTAQAARMDRPVPRNRLYVCDLAAEKGEKAA